VVAERDPFSTAHRQHGGPGFYFHRGVGALSSGDMGPEHIDGVSVPSRTMVVVIQEDGTR
jgi:hypothetical protein